MHAMLALSELRVYRPYTPRCLCHDPHSAVAGGGSAQSVGAREAGAARW